MICRSLKWPADRLLAVALAGVFSVLVAASVQEKAKPDLNGIPKKVMDGLKARFPNAEIQTWTKEEERGIVLYDVEFKQGGNKMEADIKADGTIDNWEKEIPPKALPASVRKAIDSRYPRGVIKEAMVITAVKDGKDALEGYEITLEATGKKTVEVTVAPNGRFIEDSGAKK